MTSEGAVAAIYDTDDAKEQACPNWERIEADYRAGLLSLRAIAARDGHVTEGAIRKRARKLEWARDLKARIHARAEELVRKEMVRTTGPQYATASEAAETAIVQGNAEILAHVQLTQRRGISKARQIVGALFAELDAATGDRSTRAVIQDGSLALRNSGSDGHAFDGNTRSAPSTALSLPARAATAKALAEALRVLVTLERDAWGMNEGQAAPADSGRVIDSSKLTFEERQQLRDMILKASAEPIGDEQHSSRAG